MLQLIKHFDLSLFHFINHTISNRFFDILLPVIRNANTWIPLYVILGFYCILKYKKTAPAYMLYVLFAFAISDYTTHELLKPYFARPRPCHDMFVQARLVLGNCGGMWSFPSTHASNHMALALSIVLAKISVKKVVNYMWIFWALAIGFAQIYVGVHYPTDIVAGLVYGAAIALLNYYVMLPLLVKVNKKLINKMER